MRLRTVHLIAAYVLWCLGTYSLWLGEWEDVPPYPIAIVIAAVLAFFLTDHWKRLELSSWVSNTLGVFILAKMLHDLTRGSQEALTALAHFLCYLQVAKWFREKRRLDFALIYFMNILQVAIGAILAKQSTYGVILGLYFLLATACVTLFFLANHFRELDDWAPTDRIDLGTPAQGIYRRIARGAIACWLLAIPITLLIFWLLPRIPRDTELTAGSDIEQQWTGFSPVVKLDNETRIFENDEIAFTIQSAKDGLGEDVTFPEDILWRGSVFSNYTAGSWKRKIADANLDRKTCEWKESTKPTEWTIEIDRIISTGSILFAPAGVVAADTTGRGIRHIPAEDRVVLDDGTSKRISYKVVVDTNAWKSGLVGTDTPADYLEVTAEKPENMGQTRALVEQLIEGTAPDDVRERIKRVFDYLTLSGQYSYALSAPATAPGIDPIEDFLFERKTGHCEYFASSLAVLLRFAGVHSRLVTGFKGIDSNRVGGYDQVRQLFSHAWVEAYLPDQQRWLTLDPTPGQARAEMVERKRSIFDIFEDVRDVFTRFWGYYIVNFSVEDQRRAIVAATETAAKSIGLPLSVLQDKIRTLWKRQAWLVILLGLLLSTIIVAFFWSLALAWGYLRRRWRGRTGGLFEPRHPAYEDWLKLLDRLGYRRQPSQTPREFADQVGRHWARHPDTQHCADLPATFAELWYATRFSDSSPPDDAWHLARIRFQELTDAIARRAITVPHA